jgi:hypothetical protein
VVFRDLGLSAQIVTAQVVTYAPLIPDGYTWVSNYYRVDADALLALPIAEPTKHRVTVGATSSADWLIARSEPSATSAAGENAGLWFHLDPLPDEWGSRTIRLDCLVVHANATQEEIQVAASVVVPRYFHSPGTLFNPPLGGPLLALFLGLGFCVGIGVYVARVRVRFRNASPF